MAMEMDDFKFPDEDDDIKQPEAKVEVEDGGFSVEIEDDTPVQDRNAKPLPAEEKEELEKDNLEDYSKKVKSRIDKMKKAWHDERREKEAALREQQEAVALAQRMLEENKRLKATLSEGEKQYVTTIQSAAEMELEVAKRGYKEAYDSGDADKIIEAQQKLTEASLKQDKAKNFKPTLQVEDDGVQIQQTYQPKQAAPKVDPATSKWLEKNSWYGEDDEMTALALGTHQKLEKEFGKDFVGSEDYWNRIDKTMRKRFPENFEGDDEVEVTTQSGGDKPSPRTQPRSAPVVASATRSTASKRIVLKASQVALAKKLGLTPEQYAREMQKLEA
jgi:hypothetical protein